jgi:hypothetical protein
MPDMDNKQFKMRNLPIPEQKTSPENNKWEFSRVTSFPPAKGDYNFCAMCSNDAPQSRHLITNRIIPANQCAVFCGDTCYDLAADSAPYLKNTCFMQRGRDEPSDIFSL